MKKAISQKQLTANRQNAKKGGVKTAEGKAIVRHNAVKHGLLSQELIINKEDQEVFEEFQEGIINQLKPKNDLERFMVDKIISYSWRLKLALKIERNIILWEKNYPDYSFPPINERALKLAEAQTERKRIMDIVSSDHFDRLMRYENALEHKFYRALKEYKIMKNGFVS